MLPSVVCLQTFHILKPIQSKPFKVNLIRRMQTGEAQLDPKFLGDMDKLELMTCSCENNQHYGWCIHANLHAFGTGLMTGYPRKFDPTKIEAINIGREYTGKHPNGLGGRPPKAKKGGALSGK